MRDPYYVVDGQRRPLRRTREALLVLPARDAHVVSVGSRLARSSRLAIDNTFPGDRLVVRGDPEKLAVIASYRDIRATRSAFTDEDGAEMVLTDDILVDFEPELSSEDRLRLLDEHSCELIEARDDVWIVRTRDLDPDAPLEISNRLWDQEGVVFAEPDALVRAQFAILPFPNEPRIGTQWHLRNTGVGAATARADISAREAWVRTYGDRMIAVAIFDSGVDIGHPDLRNNVGSGWDFDNSDPDASNPGDAHGTACAGLAAAPMNGVGVVGVAPRSTIIPMRAAGNHQYSAWADMFDWAVKRADIVSCSWSIPESNLLSKRIRLAIKAGRVGRGAPMFFCTQNWSATSISYPARMRETIAVGATTDRDVRADFSNIGTGIDIVAPGVGLGTTDIAGVAGYSTIDYTGFSGTSAATPVAAGTAALMLALNPMLSAEQVRRILHETAEKVDTAHANYDVNGWSTAYGYGRIDANAALCRVSDHRPVALRTSNGHYLCAEDGGGREVTADRSTIATWETFQMIGVGTNQVVLRAHNGQYVSAQGGGGGAVHANRDHQATWETFTVHHLGDGKVALSTLNGRYVCAEGGGGSDLVADRTQCHTWETFEFVRLLPGTPVALRTSGGQYLCAEGGGGGALSANRAGIGPWENFELIEVGTKIALRSAKGWYLSALGGGGGAVVVNRGHIATWEQFDLVKLGGDKIGLRTHDGHYLCAESGGGGAVVADGTQIKSWETFDLQHVRPTKRVTLKTQDGHWLTAVNGGGSEVLADHAGRCREYEEFGLFDLGGGEVALRAHSGEYVRAEGGGGRELIANQQVLGAWERFALIDLSGGKVALRASNGQYVCAEGGGGGKVTANRTAIHDCATFEMVKAATRAPPAP
jgi:hypothetical protein